VASPTGSLFKSNVNLGRGLIFKGAQSRGVLPPPFPSFHPPSIMSVADNRSAPGCVVVVGQRSSCSLRLPRSYATPALHAPTHAQSKASSFMSPMVIRSLSSIQTRCSTGSASPGSTLPRRVSRLGTLPGNGSVN
jgi:hypothetical protein